MAIKNKPLPKTTPPRTTASDILKRFDNLENTAVQDAMKLLREEERQDEALRMKEVLRILNARIRTAVEDVRRKRKAAREAENQLESINEAVAKAVVPGATAASIKDTFNAIAPFGIRLT